MPRTCQSGTSALLRQILDAGIHGISFSPYIEGQGPGTRVEALQIRERLAVIQPFHAVDSDLLMQRRQ